MTNISSITAYMKNMKGLSLIELVVVLAILSILIAVGLPRMQGISQGNRVTTAINTLSADMALTRSEAVTRNVSVTITSNNGADWSAGWVVATTGGAPVVLRNGPPLANGILLNGSVSVVTYLSDGTQAAGAILTFKSCKSGDVTDHGREIRISTAGRIRLLKGQTCPI